MKIIVDQREKKSLVADKLKKLGNKIEYKRLPVADYLVNGIAIERKTANDFINSMINKRLIRQLEEMQQFKKALLLIEGDLKETGFDQAPLRGMILSTIIDYNIPVIFTEDPDETAAFVTSLIKRIQKGKNDFGLRAKKRTYSTAEQQQMVIEGLPSVGPNLAKALLKKFKTIKQIVNANEQELCKVEKIGKIKAKTIKILLEEIYRPR